MELNRERINPFLNLTVLLMLVIVATGLRIWYFPSRYELRAVDELGYSQGSPELLEGMTPAYKYAPAGPQTWLGWGYAGIRAARYMVAPTTEERIVPFQVRPFVAVNHALFELYRDLSGLRRFIIIVSMLLSLLAVWAAFRVGLKWAQLPGAVLLGGLFAFPPLLVDSSVQARSFSMGWSLVMISVYFAVCRTSRVALWGAAIFMGLAIAQRIDMIIFLPVVWILLKAGSVAFREFLRKFVQFNAIALVTTLLLAPWLLTNIIGNLRTIATVRFSEPSSGAIPWTTTLFDFSWHEGLGLVAILFVAGIVIGLVKRTLLRPALCLYALLLLPSVCKSTGHGTAHNGAVIILLFITAPLALTAISNKPKLKWVLVTLALLLPMFKTVQMVRAERQSYVPDDATRWVESHVPQGTILYVMSSLNDPLPTSKRADELWEEEMNVDAAKKKFQAGLNRFHLQNVEIPRALSEENMIVERVERRGWYILGSRNWLPDRRFDIQLYAQSIVFGPFDPLPDFKKTGGVLIWRGAPLAGAGEPVAKWTAPSGDGTFIYCSDNLRSLLNP